MTTKPASGGAGASTGVVPVSIRTGLLMRSSGGVMPLPGGCAASVFNAEMILSIALQRSTIVSV